MTTFIWGTVTARFPPFDHISKIINGHVVITFVGAWSRKLVRVFSFEIPIWTAAIKTVVDFAIVADTFLRRRLTNQIT